MIACPRSVAKTCDDTGKVDLRTCQDEPPLPILTREAFFKAAAKCQAIDPIFTFRPNSRPPSISFAVPSSDLTPGKTAQCLVDALVGYRSDAMQIRVAELS